MTADLLERLNDSAAVPYLGAAVFAFALAIVAGIADLRRRKRIDPDRIGWLDWRSVQMLALIAAVMLTIIALHD